jgi:peptidoglycan/LPS O-acetylase OafA/YrhL
MITFFGGFVGGFKFIPALGGLRAIAALMVFHQHATKAGLLPNAFGTAGDCGVMLFFCLSGFLMAELYLRQEASWASIRDFIRARFARIYPLFAIVVLGSALIYYFDHRFPFRLDASEVKQHLLLFGSWFTLWTISVEFQFYAIFIAFWMTWAALPEKCREAGLALICMASVLILWLAGYPGGKIAITHYLHFFLVGILAAMIVWRAADRFGRAAGFVLPVLLAVSVLGLFMFEFGEAPDSYRSFPLLIWAGTIILAAAAGKGFFAERILGSRLLVYLGELSFGIYLLHRPVMYLWMKLIGLRLHWSLMFLLISATLLAASHLAYCWIEQPARRALLRNRSRIGRDWPGLRLPWSEATRRLGEVS